MGDELRYITVKIIRIRSDHVLAAIILVSSSKEGIVLLQGKLEVVHILCPKNVMSFGVSYLVLSLHLSNSNGITGVDSSYPPDKKENQIDPKDTL